MEKEQANILKLTQLMVDIADAEHAKMYKLGLTEYAQRILKTKASKWKLAREKYGSVPFFLARLHGGSIYHQTPLPINKHSFNLRASIGWRIERTRLKLGKTSAFVED